MISLDEIEKSILELEQRDTTFSNCERLAPLYIVRDHLRKYSADNPNPIDATGTSEFIKAVNGKNANEVWKILDDLMKAIYAMHKNMYYAVIEKIKDI